MGLKNEARIGMTVNYARYDYPYRGEPYYEDNFGLFLLSGWTNRNLKRPTEDPFVPFEYRDKRNFHLIVAPEGRDANNNNSVNSNESGSLENQINSNSNSSENLNKKKIGFKFRNTGSQVRNKFYFKKAFN